MKPKSIMSILMYLATALLAANPVLAQGEKLFYRGELDKQKVEAPNGAVVNADYRKFILEGAWGKTRMTRVRDGVHTITGYSLSNYTFIEGKTGLIVVDAGSNIGMGRKTLAMIREISDKPIVAVIYTHHHYTGGLEDYPHPNIQFPCENLLLFVSAGQLPLLYPQSLGLMQFLFPLPARSSYQLMQFLHPELGRAGRFEWP